jgi:hypothetical protein
VSSREAEEIIKLLNTIDRVDERIGELAFTISRILWDIVARIEKLERDNV